MGGNRVWATELGRRWALALLLTPALAVATSATVWAADADFDHLMSVLAQRQHGHVTFVEKKFIALLDKPVVSSGELLYDAPDHFEKRTLQPKPEDLVLDNGVVSAQRGKHRYVINLKQYPQVLPFIESIRATLAGDRPGLEKVFKVGFSGTFEQWSLHLVPLDAQLVKTVRDIQIEGAHDRINSMLIQETDGDHSELTVGADVAQ